MIQSVTSNRKLAAALGVSDEALRLWRSEKPDAPKSNDVEEWRAFIARNELGEGNNRLNRATPELRARKLLSEIRLNELKISKEERKLIPAEQVDDFLLWLSSRVKSGVYQAFTTELPPKLAGLDVGEIRRLSREAADALCITMQSAVDDWHNEQQQAKAAAQTQ